MAVAPSNFSQTYKDHAKVIIALQAMFMGYSTNLAVMDGLVAAGYPSFEVLSFLSSIGLFFHDYALYSAGNAELDIQKSRAQDWPLWTRRPNTLLMADSGGFQTAQGRWSTSAYFAMKELILRWQEAIADVAIAMDVPTLTVLNGFVRSYWDALQLSKINFLWQVENRNPDSGLRLLNVVQGLFSHGDESPFHWYDSIKILNDERIWGRNAFQGWALGGFWGLPTLTMARLLARMFHDGMLSGRNNFVHVLGITEPRRVASFTLLMRALRIALDDPDFTMTSDSSNPIQVVGQFGHVYRDGLTDEQPDFVGLTALPDRSWLHNSGPHRFGFMTIDDPRSMGRELCGSDYMQLAAVNKMFGSSCLAGAPLQAVGDLVVRGDSKGRLNPLGYAVFMFISQELFLRKTYQESAAIVARKQHLVPRLAAAIRSETPETRLSLIHLD